jgi:nitrite reductase/ring-hydroxylating ferredoxin subunit
VSGCVFTSCGHDVGSVKGSDTMQRRTAGRVDDIEPGTSMTVDGDIPIALFRTDQDEFFATADTCTHEKWSLGEDSDLEGDEVICPLHMARFDIRTGKALCFPATVALQTFAVEVEDGLVYIIE